MRLWSIHPMYLDAKGLLALWREGLLAQKVLLGLTRGYVNHPQLIRFKNTSDPILYIGTYLYYVYLEGLARGYRFNVSKIKVYNTDIQPIPVTTGQLLYEFNHLLSKLAKRSHNDYMRLQSVVEIIPHPIFKPVPGDIEAWEKVK